MRPGWLLLGLGGLVAAVYAIGANDSTLRSRDAYDGPIVANVLEEVVSTSGESALKAGKRGHPVTSVFVSIKSTDKYGAAGEVGAGTFRWDPEDVSKVQWDSIDKWQLLELAQFEPNTRDGVAAFRYWCVESGYGRDLTPGFCRGGLILKAPEKQ